MIAATKQDYELGVLLHQASDAMVRARENELRQVGISRMQAAVLFVVEAAEGPVTPAEISRRLVREPNTVFELLNRMERDGLIRKVRDLERKNQIRVAITEKGEEAYHRSRKGKVLRKILSSLSREEQDNLRAYLETLRNKARALSAKRPRKTLMPTITGLEK